MLGFTRGFSGQGSTERSSNLPRNQSGQPSPHQEPEGKILAWSPWSSVAVGRTSIEWAVPPQSRIMQVLWVWSLRVVTTGISSLNRSVMVREWGTEPFMGDQ